ncbi:uncharacterized protein N7479_003597 [Penicillium vulpinum]|uniref:Uncharacterized protein n=1 Tax=Penicillium vulpinum TaxID=29845 RepID=A0A1V6RWE0_9EURO|nr:uncharacterized protein N7479_003597 [Penicillium vulpinum]KAJ5963721.1 hypothetical protein N7479_003597 [Penicillium vulpinum]OQE06075.1 hypothetical protein PENVUL_c020G03371 [Penicillium vulpinum]
MRTTRQKRKAGDVLLPGLPDEKRVRTPKPPGGSPARVSKPSAKKGKKKHDPSLPHVALANSLLEDGDSLRLQGSSLGQNFPPPTVWGPREEPITDPTQLPEGWSVSETDLADDDIDGQIQRCQRRIGENMMPDIFKERLKMYQKIKEEHTEMINSEPSGLSWEVVQRLDILKNVQTSLEELGRDNGNTPNVMAIMAAYRSGDLVWDQNTVTYWAHGRIVAGPKKMDTKEFFALTEKLGPEGIWVEGLDDYKPPPLNLWFTMGPHHADHATHAFVVSLRNPRTASTHTPLQTIHIQVLEDTGASTMKMFQADKQQLEALSGHPLPVSSTSIMTTANGDVQVDNFIVQANIFCNNQPMLPQWTDIRVSVAREPPNTSPSGFRLSGVWIHHMLYCLSMPDNSLNMHVGTSLLEILASVPLCDPALAIPPPIHP